MYVANTSWGFNLIMLIVFKIKEEKSVLKMVHYIEGLKAKRTIQKFMNCSFCFILLFEIPIQSGNNRYFLSLH